MNYAGLWAYSPWICKRLFFSVDDLTCMLLSCDIYETLEKCTWYGFQNVTFTMKLVSGNPPPPKKTPKLKKKIKKKPKTKQAKKPQS